MEPGGASVVKRTEPCLATDPAPFSDGTMSPRLIRCLLVSVLVLTTAACSIRPRPRAAQTPAGQRELIVTAAQIEKSGASSAWEALQIHVRNTHFAEDGYGNPQRVRRRGASTVMLYEDMPIYVDHVQIADVQLLRDMPAREIERIRVLTGIDGTTYYGTGASDGVILIFTKGGR
jgi:outer membrane cobalamin receptor